MAFTGIPETAFTFYEALAADNTRTFWLANKTTYTDSVRAPMEQLLAVLEGYGPFHVFRPNKDVRFAKDKTPYKDHFGAYGESQGGAGFYLQLSAGGLMAASGYYGMANDQLDRYRRAADAPNTGAEIERITTALEKSGLRIGAIGELKSAPRGYPKDHPRITLLRRKGLMASREWPVAAWMSTKAAVGKVRGAWQAASDMNEWLDLHVGPSTIAPDEDELARFGPL
jgi:uncharacterized protein (TIGR02453 family)